MKKELLHAYAARKKRLKERLGQFSAVPAEKYFEEFIFCMLTPQSNAHKCWLAVQQLKELPRLTAPKVKNILKRHTRFHNNKTRYILQAETTWKEVVPRLSNANKKELRDWLAQNVKGYGLKEAGHFLRNIGHSGNQIAILDRHILRNLHALKVVRENKIKSKKHYYEIENAFLDFSKKMQIPIDELDLLFWSKETGEIFK